MVYRALVAAGTWFPDQIEGQHVVLRRHDPANLPALIHCTAGKDRTGLIAALVQLLAGVSREVVVADYLLTNRLYAPRARAFTRTMRWISLFRVPSGNQSSWPPEGKPTPPFLKKEASVA